MCMYVYVRMRVCECACVCVRVCDLAIMPIVGEVYIFKHRLYISALKQAKTLILGKYVLPGSINTFYAYCHASVILWKCR